MKKNTPSYLILILAGVAIGWLVFSNLEFTFPDKESKLTVSNTIKLAEAAENFQDRPIRTLKDFNQAFVDIAESATPSVVTIFTEKTVNRRFVSPFDLFGRSPFDDFFQSPGNGRPDSRKEVLRGLGSGVIVSKDGYILTNNHVVDKADSIYIRTSDNRKLQAKVIGTDPKTDVAVLKTEAKNLKPIAIGDSDLLRVGEWVIAIGSPLGEKLARTVTQGIVSAKGRANVGLADYEDFIQTDAAINPGNSGGPLVNINGELVGINTAIASRTGGFQGIGFAVPSNMARQIMQSLITSGKVTRGWLGVTIQDVDENIAKGLKLKDAEGVLVGTVVPDSPAKAAGLKTGDVILKLDDKKVLDTIELRNSIAATPPGTKVKVTIWRDGSIRNLMVKLQEIPDQPIAAEQAQEMSDLLGFNAAPMSPEIASKYRLKTDAGKVVVSDVDPSGNAYRAGLRSGDVIKAVNRKNITSYKQFLSIVGKMKKGDLLFLLIERGGSNVYFAFNL